MVKEKAKGYRRARQRASRACEVCHARKVRCDVTIHKPCTNCVAFGCECRIPESKTRNRKSREDSEEEETRGNNASDEDTYVKPILRAPPHPSENTIFMGSASYVPLFTSGEENLGSNYSRLVFMDKKTHITREDIAVLKLKGSFYLPPKEVCKDLVDAYFEKIHPYLPCINKNAFLKRFNDPDNQPPLLLMQCLFCAAAHVCKNPTLKDEEGSTRYATELFYKRAKALFDSDYESDRTVSMVSALLLSLALDSPDRVNNNIFYWCRVAVTLAHSIGIHRWIHHKKRTDHQNRMFRRIWWSVFVRDRSTATAYGRPMMINLEDSDVPMVEADDFLEDEDGPPEFPTSNEQVLYFMNVVKLHEIMGLVLRQQYSVGAERLRLQNQLPDVTQCDIALATWINNIPEPLRYSIREISRHTFLTSLIYLQYYAVLCLAHRPQVIHFSHTRETPYPSWGIAFQAAHMIVRIFENLRHFDQITDLPAFSVYTAFSALIMLVYQLESSHRNVSEVAEKALNSLLMSIKMLGNVYDTAKEIAQVADRLRNSSTNRRSLRLVKRAAATTEQSEEYRPTVEHQKKFKVDAPEPPVHESPVPQHRPTGPGVHELSPKHEPETQPVHPTHTPAHTPAHPTHTPVHPAHTPVHPAHTPVHAQVHPHAHAQIHAHPHAHAQLHAHAHAHEHLQAHAQPPYHPDSPRDLYMVTQDQDQIPSFEPQLLFPEVKELPEKDELLAPLFTTEQGLTHLLDETTPTRNESSGDEGAPTNLAMVDWYDFLMTNQEYKDQS